MTACPRADRRLRAVVPEPTPSRLDDPHLPSFPNCNNWVGVPCYPPWPSQPGCREVMEQNRTLGEGSATNSVVTPKIFQSIHYLLLTT